jgi:hypothetical protein
VPARPGKPIDALTSDPTTSSASASVPPPDPGHAPTPFFARRSATRHRALAAWPGDAGSFPRISSLGGAPGVQSLRRFPPADGWIRRLKPAAWHSSGISADPGPRAVRDLLSAPIIFVGVTDRLLEKRDLKGARPGMRWRRLLGFAPVCGPFPRATSSRIVPALGFASCRVGGRTTAHPGGHVTAADHQPPESARRITATGELPIRSWVCGDPHRSEMHNPSRAARRACLLPTERCSRSASPSLQRIDGADAWPVRPMLHAPIGSAPCLRFCTVRRTKI